MNPFLDAPQIEELMEFGFYDDEETKFQVEDYYDYDDLSVGIDFSNTNDFWCLTFFLIANWLILFPILRILMMPDQLDFSGNIVTVLGFVGVISTAIILVTVYRSYWRSPYRKWHSDNWHKGDLVPPSDPLRLTVQPKANQMNRVSDAINQAFAKLSETNQMIYDYWISELYDEDGDLIESEWNETNLKLMETDVKQTSF